MVEGIKMKDVEAFFELPQETSTAVTEMLEFAVLMTLNDSKDNLRRKVEFVNRLLERGDPNADAAIELILGFGTRGGNNNEV